MLVWLQSLRHLAHTSQGRTASLPDVAGARPLSERVFVCGNGAITYHSQSMDESSNGDESVRAVEQRQVQHLRWHASHADGEHEYRLFKRMAVAWPLGWAVLVVATLTLQVFAMYLAMAVLIGLAAALLANIWGGVLVWRQSGHCPRWLAFEVLLLTGIPAVVFWIASAAVRNARWQARNTPLPVAERERNLHHRTAVSLPEQGNEG